jgi:L-alanine-DL-glutamate epimerase-like enolase superfamily enzyme
VSSSGVRILQPDVSKTGGLTEALAVAELANANGKEVVPHFFGGAVTFAATLQFAACARPVTAIEYDIRENPLRDPLWRGVPRPVGGSIAIPTGPGLGIDLDLSLVAEFLKPIEEEIA